MEDFKPHVVLLDIMMPGMGGIDVLRGIRNINPEIGVIMTTAVTNEEIAKRAMKFGAYDYITKPLDLNYLETVLMVKMIDVYVCRTSEGKMGEEETDKTFGAIAVKMGFITEKQLEEALYIQAGEEVLTGKRRPLGRILVNKGLITFPQMGEVMESLEQSKS
ncbi:MAG: response regulator [Deltaproteobacteria bacterium]|nr:response regulator [Deltaproteobacteria bacterium]